MDSNKSLIDLVNPLREIFRKDSKMVYFDNAATSIRPISFVESYCEFSGVGNYDFVFELIQKISEYLCVNKDNLSLVFNASIAANVIAQGIVDNHQFINQSRKIYISRSEHVSTVWAWENISQEHKWEIVFFDISEWNRVCFEPDSVVVMSLTTNLVGYVVDVNEVCQFFKEVKKHKPIVLVLDVSQVLPHKHVQLKEKKVVDYMFFTGHKFFGPNGVAVIYSCHGKFGVNLSNPENWKKESLDWRGIYAWNKSFLDISVLFKTNSLGESVVNIREKGLLEFFREHFPKNIYLEWINKDVDSLIFLMKTTNVKAHDFVFYLEKNGVVARTGLCCSYSPDLKDCESNILRVSLSFCNTISELRYFFDLISQYTVDMSF